jgi:hypothetical protein
VLHKFLEDGVCGCELVGRHTLVEQHVVHITLVARLQHRLVLKQKVSV